MRGWAISVAFAVALAWPASGAADPPAGSGLPAPPATVPAVPVPPPAPEPAPSATPAPTTLPPPPVAPAPTPAPLSAEDEAMLKELDLFVLLDFLQVFDLFADEEDTP